MFSNEFYPKKPQIFVCEKCDFKSSNKKDYNRHILTKKHNFLKNQCLSMDFTPKNPCSCSCGKTYKDNSGLWRHKKKCEFIKEENLTINSPDEQHKIIEFLMKENLEFKQLMKEQNKQMILLSKNIGNNNNNTINNNQQFNLQLYLNETCKNAMNIMDFVNQLQIENIDLEETGRLGFANGISRIFINGLKQMNIPDRPIHCSDLKRETLYIKNNNEWNKEGENKILLTNAIKQVAHKNMKQILEWRKDNPEFNDPNAKINDKYLKIVSESMSGSSVEETNKNYSKIIKSIVKETVIDKSNDEF